jgi:hypothetical protein
MWGKISVKEQKTMFSIRTQSKTTFLMARLLFVAPSIMMCAGALEAQTVNWVATGSPSARSCMGMAYDGATQSTVLFGGVGPSSDQVYGDTWIWRGGWLQKAPATSPSPRTCAGMAYDAAAGNSVLFGGYSSSGTFLNDTWTWDGTTWTQQFPPISPSARSQPAMAYDATAQTVVLFGGCNISSGPCVLGDTWTWDGVAKAWTKLNPASSPSARRAPIAYDNASGNVLLFGGDNAVGVQYTDTWNWNGTTWTQQLPASSPSARTSAAMTYDASLGMIVLFGGYAGIWEDSLNDTWIRNGTTWTQIHPATTPPNRYAFGMDYDPVDRVVVMFGGYSSTVARGDTWLLALEP